MIVTTRFCAVALGVATLLGSGIYYAAIRPRNGIWVSSIRSDFNRRCPLGTPRREVLAWFSENGIDPIDIIDERHKRVGFIGTIGNSTPLQYARIDIACEFDAAGRLRDVVIDRFADWP